MLEQRIMGCGRSKPHSRSDSIDGADVEKKRKKSKLSNDKNHKVGDRKENVDPAGKDKKGGGPVRKDSGVLKNHAGLPNANGNQQHGDYRVSGNSLCDDKKMSKLQNNLSANNTQNKINSMFQKQLRITNSQIEFFKMLDEKIEQGRDLSDDDVSQKNTEESSVGIVT